MATLYTHRSENIRRTWLLMTVFFALIVFVGWVFSYRFNNYGIFLISVAFAVVSTVLSFWFSDKVVVALARAKPVAKQDDPELYRIVENLCITAGLPTPRIYIVDDPSPNAFATGRDAKHAVVAVTSGLRQILDKTELEGVIAHELSHIGNRDMLVATVAAVLAGIIVTLADLFVRMTFFGGFSRDNDRREGSSGALAVIGILGAVILAPIAATLIRLAISRKRELLADTSGVLLTRYPEGLISALQKISAVNLPMKQSSAAIAHLWLADPDKGRKNAFWFSRLFMTHPPIEERIKSLEQVSV